MQYRLAMGLKKHLPLIVGIGVPVLMILFIIGSIYFPRLTAKPQYDFLHTNDGPHYYGYRRYTYSVEGNRLVRTQVDVSAQVSAQHISEPELFRHDTARNTSRKISFEEALALTLDRASRSPDGFEVGRGGGADGIFPFFFGGRDYNAVYLRKGNYAEKLNLIWSGNYYYGNSQFLGWVLK